MKGMAVEPKICACAPSTPVQGGGFWTSGGWLLAALPAWTALYLILQPLAGWLAFRALGLAPGSRLGEAVASERCFGLAELSPELMELAKRRYPNMSREELELLASSVLSVQVEATKGVTISSRACCAPTCCG